MADGSNSHGGRSGVVEVRNHVDGRVVVHSPCNHGNVEAVGDSHDCIHHSSEELASSVASLQCETNAVNNHYSCTTNIAYLLMQLLQHRFYQQL